MLGSPDSDGDAAGSDYCTAGGTVMVELATATTGIVWTSSGACPTKYDASAVGVNGS